MNNKVSKFYFIRHEVHGENGMPKQALTPEARTRAINVGKKLKEMGVSFDYIACSWQPRAIETILCYMQGMDKLLPIDTSQAIGDAVSGAFSFTKEQVTAIKAEAKEAGMDTEAYLLIAKDLKKQMANRGHEGSEYILGQMMEHGFGAVGAGASHGGSRMEVVLMDLLNRSPYFPIEYLEAPFFFKRGSVAELQFDESLNLMKVFYYGDFNSESVILM